MDPTARTNALRQYMDFYRQNVRPVSTYAAPGSFGFGMSQAPNDGAALNFAESQMAPQTPDFYDSQTPSYTAPQSVQSIAGAAGFPLAPQDRQTVTRRPDGGMGDMAMNYLRNLFTRR